MKCPDCDGEAHPKWRAHWFRSNDNSNDKRNDVVVDAVVTQVSKAPSRQVEWQRKNRERYNARMRAWRLERKA